MREHCNFIILGIYLKVHFVPSTVCVTKKNTIYTRIKLKCIQEIENDSN